MYITISHLSRPLLTDGYNIALQDAKAIQTLLKTRGISSQITDYLTNDHLISDQIWMIMGDFNLVSSTAGMDLHRQEVIQNHVEFIKALDTNKTKLVFLMFDVRIFPRLIYNGENWLEGKNFYMISQNNLLSKKENLESYFNLYSDSISENNVLVSQLIPVVYLPIVKENALKWNHIFPSPDEDSFDKIYYGSSWNGTLTEPLKRMGFGSERDIIIGPSYWKDIFPNVTHIENLPNTEIYRYINQSHNCLIPFDESKKNGQFTARILEALYSNSQIQWAEEWPGFFKNLTLESTEEYLHKTENEIIDWISKI